jgi:hypothetical protein
MSTKEFRNSYIAYIAITSFTHFPDEGAQYLSETERLQIPNFPGTCIPMVSGRLAKYDAPCRHTHAAFLNT